MRKNKIFQPAVKSGNQIKIPPTESINNNTLKPTFSFIHMKYRGKTCLSKFDQANKSFLTDTLLELSQLTWNQIITGRVANHEKIPIRQFRNPLPISITPDIEKLVVFHFSRAGRMAGFQSGNIYHIVQVSSNHDLY